MHGQGKKSGGYGWSPDREALLESPPTAAEIEAAELATCAAVGGLASLRYRVRVLYWNVADDARVLQNYRNRLKAHTLKVQHDGGATSTGDGPA